MHVLSAVSPDQMPRVHLGRALPNYNPPVKTPTAVLPAG